jgi:LysM repeat protein
MRKQIILLFLCCICSSKMFASAQDTVRYLTENDTILITKNEYGEKIYTHTMQQGQTLWSLARFYGLKPEELQRFNTIYDNEIFSLGDKVRVPIPNKAIIRFENSNLNKSKLLPVCYVVKRGDTMFGIAQRDYKMPIDTLVRRNNLQGKSLQPGQILHTGWMSINGVPDSLQNHQAYTSFDKDSRAAAQFEIDRARFNERGPVVWMKDKKKGGKKMVAILHNKARVGKVIEIYNPSNKRTVFAKVIGRIPSGAYDPSIIAVLTQYAAKMLGAKDKKFFVEIKYK